MADQGTSEMSGRAGEQIAYAGQDLKDRAAEIAGSSAEAVKDHASDFIGAARDVGSHAAGLFNEGAKNKREEGARYVSSVAEAMRRAADEFDQDLPVAGTYLRKGAAQVETASESLRKGDFADLLKDARAFARRQPTAFLGLAVLAGFGAVRFLKSSAEDSSGSDSAPDNDQARTARGEG